MRIALTGANGFIGRYLVPILLAEGHEVIAISSKPDGFPHEGLSWLKANLLNEIECRDAIRTAKAECIVHLAWHSAHGKFWTSSENFAWSNATANLLTEFSQTGGRRIIFAGTCAEYDSSHGYCSEDITPTAPTTIYGKCKDATRQYAQIYCKEHALEFVWGRVFSPYGPGEQQGRLLPSVLRSMLLEEPVRCSHGRQYRDFLHVSDVASAFVHLATGTDETGIFNVSSGKPVQISEIIGVCASFFTKAPAIEFGAIPVSDFDPMMLVGSSEKLIRTGWKARISLQEGLLDYRNNLLI